MNFHGIMAGEVLSHELSKDADAIKLTIFINKPYDAFVRKNTRFWVDSGVDLSAGADGFQVRTGPLVSLLSGGIAFRTASEDTPEEVADENAAFHLYENYEKSTEVTYKNSLKYVMYFTSSVRGLTLGAPVQLRGIPVGRVTDISLELDKKTAEIRVPVVVELELDRMRLVNDLPTVSNKDMMQNLINKGLSAQLQTGSLLTGQLLVDLDFYPKAKTVHPDAKDVASVYPVFPTIASSIDQITHSAQMIMDKIAKLPLEQMSSEVTQTLQTVRTTAGHADTTLSAATATLAETEKTMSSAKQVLQSLEPGSTTHYELDKLLQELNQTANSVKRLTDYLQQHPDTLLRGKPNE
ncbi:PqiB family protein [Methylocucumis oryzae]|uniref:PqiB family protein n=1 Tax=Methylocucumis oryzae TaxID=1632867 RepID=UPI001EFA02E6|nr:MlaD family protein [Methylocucumis oryzae]